MINMNRETIIDLFANLLKSLRKAFDGVCVAEVYRYLIDTLQRDIPRTQDLQEIFDFLSSSHLWTYQNYGLVENLDKNFLQCGDNSIQQHIDEYRDKLTGYFAAEKIIRSEFFRNSGSESTTQSVTEYSHDHRKKLGLRLHFKRKLSDECLTYVADLWNSLAKTFELPSITAVIDSIVEKCLEITWLILPADAEKIVALAKVHSNFFQEHMIMSLTIDNNIIYEEVSIRVSFTSHARYMTKFAII